MEDDRSGLCRRRLIGGAAALAAVEIAALRCGKDRPLEAPPSVSFPESELAEGGRRNVMLGKNPVEIRREEGAVNARLLRCTHTGCIVRWKAAEKTYVCPCHDGRFNAGGMVIAGPPPLPLRDVPVLLAAGMIVVGG